MFKCIESSVVMMIATAVITEKIAAVYIKADPQHRR